MKKTILRNAAVLLLLLFLMPVTAFAAIRRDATDAYKLLHDYIINNGTYTYSSNGSVYVKTFTLNGESYNFFVKLNSSTDYVELRAGKYNRTICLDNEGSTTREGDYSVSGVDMGYTNMQMANRYKYNIKNYSYGRVSFKRYTVSDSYTTPENASVTENNRLNSFLPNDLRALEQLMMTYVSPDVHWGSLGYKGLCSYHKSNNGKVTSQPTCTQAGKKEYTCQYCGKKMSEETIPATGHQHTETINQKEATCTLEGYSGDLFCTDCQTVVKRGSTVPKAAHTWDAGVVTLAATETYSGIKTFTCTVCGTARTETIPMKPVTYGAGTVPAAQMEKQILSITNDGDPAGSTYSLLQAQAKKVKKNTIKITWKRVPGAMTYIVYGNKCGRANRFQKIAAVSGTSFTHKKLKAGTYYKYLIVATRGTTALATSKAIHAATSGGKVGNAKAVKVNKTKVTLTKGKKFKLKASPIAQSAKLKMKKHRGIAFESSNPLVATVNSKGVIAAKGKGSCAVYAYAQNGVPKAVKVIVK